MAKLVRELTELTVQNAESQPSPYKLFDGGGLFLLVNPNGSRYWRFKYRFQGKEKLLALGVFPTVKLPDARKGCSNARDLLKKGIDPNHISKDDSTRDSRFRTLFEESSLATLILENQTVVDCNKRALEMFACSDPNELNGIKLGDDSALPDSNISRFRALTGQLLATTVEHPTQSLDLTFLRLNGSEFQAKTSIKKFIAGDHELFEVVINDDQNAKNIEEFSEFRGGLFDLAIQLSNLGYWVWDEEEKRCIFASEEYAKIQGLTVEQVLTRYNTVERDLELLHPDDRERFLEVSEYGDTDIYEVEYRIIRPDGELRHIYEIGQEVRDENEKPIRSFGIIQDITERKKAAEDLRNNEELFKQAAHIANMGHYLWDDAKDILVFVSEEYARIHGLTVEEIYSTYNSREKDMELVHPQDRQRVLEGYYKYDEEIDILDFEYRIIRPSGETRVIREIVTPKTDKMGRRTHTIGTVQDITEQKLAHEALQERSELLKQAASISKLGYANWDEVTQEYNKVSEEYAQIFGYNAEEFLEKFKTQHADMTLIYPEDRKIVEQFNSLPPTTRACEYRIVHRDGSVRHVKEIEWDVVGETEDQIQTLTTLQDITELKKTENELRIARDTAEAANKAKSLFLSRLSHELRTPMNAILGFGQLLQTTPKATLEEKGAEFVDHILDAGRHLQTLIDDVLDLGQIDSGNIRLKMEEADSDKILRESIRLIQSMADKQEVTLHFRKPKVSSPSLYIDKTRLQQVLLNLMSNAIKYNVKGGRVLISSNTGNNGMQRITITNTGKGITKSDMAELFEPFERLGAENSKIEGTGIGLTITKQLVKMMGGQLGVESREDIMTTFWIDLRVYSKSRLSAVQ